MRQSAPALISTSHHDIEQRLVFLHHHRLHRALLRRQLLMRLGDAFAVPRLAGIVTQLTAVPREQ